MQGKCGIAISHRRSALSFRFFVNFIGAVAIRRVLLHEVQEDPNIDPVTELNDSKKNTRLLDINTDVC